MNDVSATARHNKILHSLSDEVIARLAPDLEPLDLLQGTRLFGPDDKIDHLYFPVGAMISIVGITSDGGAAEIGLMGDRSIAGIEALLGGVISPHEMMAQLPGPAFRLKVAAAQNEFNRCGEFQAAALDFVRRFLLQVSQNVVCNRLHNLEERVSKWLLMCADRYRYDNLPLTQEFLALMAGSTRASVTLSAIALRDMGYINYTRGKITILDRKGLGDMACDCYRTIVEGYSV